MKIYVTGFGITMKLFLRRTLVLYNFAKQKIQHPDSDCVSGYAIALGNVTLHLYNFWQL